MSTTTFGVWDYLVFGLMLCASITIGIYHAVRGRNQSTSDYLVAGRSMTWFPVALSLIATFESSIMMLGTPAESYVYGVAWILSELGSSLGTIFEIVVVLAFFRNLDLSSPYEYFERRFSSRILRRLTNIISSINYLNYMSMVLYGQAVALEAVTGLSMYSSILLTAGVTVIYTCIGGLKAVIWTDVLQFFIMVTGILAVSIKGTVDAGGAVEVWTRAAQSGRLDISLDPDPTVRHTVWNLFFGRIVTGLGVIFSPAALQRITSTTTLRDSRRAMFILIPGFIFFIGMALVEGIVAFSYFSYKGCDPLESKQIETPNQIVPFLIMDLFKHLPGMPGLLLAALSSASLSTISSCLSAISVITLNDLVKPFWPNMSDFRGVIIAKAAVVVSGSLGCLLAILVSLAGSRTLNQISYTFGAVTRNPVVGLFYLGLLFPFVNAKGAISGFVTGVVFMGWLVIGSMFSASGNNTPYYPLGSTDQCPDFNLTTAISDMSNDMLTSQYDGTTTISNTSTPDQVTSANSGVDVFYSLSYTLFSSVSITVVLLVGVLASLATGGWGRRADPKLVIRLADIQCWCLPQERVQHTETTKSNEEVKMIERPYSETCMVLDNMEI